MGKNCWKTQVIKPDGKVNKGGLKHVLTNSRFADCLGSYAVVAIMGPQSSGKSTLCNELFQTKFQVMDANNERSKTTEGIWIAGCSDTEPFTIVMDLEGTDGSERGEDDTIFEKQSALFALAIADIVIINMWCHDLGRAQAGNRPLLKTVFEAMLRMPENFRKSKTTLLFVLRDKTKTPLERLEAMLRTDIHQIWNEVASSLQESTSLSEFFNVEVTALSNYEMEENHFKGEVSQLRQRFFHSISPRGLAGDRNAASLASTFSHHIQQTWQTIKENKDLHIPAHKALVAAVGCEEIAIKLLDNLKRDEGLQELNRAALSGPVSGFRDRFLCILNPYLQEYDTKTMNFDEGVRCEKRQQLQSRALDLAYPAYAAILGHLRSTVLEEFKRRLEQTLKRGEGFNASKRSCTESCMDEFNKGVADAAIAEANWDASKIRESLRHDIKSHCLREITSRSENKVTKELCEPIESLFKAGGEGTWASVSERFRLVIDVAILELSNNVVCLELDDDEISGMKENLREYARNIVKEKAKEEAKKVDLRMKDRFSRVFNLDDYSRPRVWTGKEDINAITKKALAASLELLSVVAAIRLGENHDNIRNMLLASLIHGSPSSSIDHLASDSWDEVCSEDTLIKPMECRTIWMKFKDDIEYMVTQAIMAEKAYKRKKRVEVAQAVLATCLATAIPLLVQLI